MNNKKLKKIDILLLIFLPIFAIALSLTIKTNFLVFTLLGFGPLALWLSYREPGKILKTLIFSSISIPSVIIIDYINTLSVSWYVPTIFSFRILGVIPLEDFIFTFFFYYTVVIFYEHFSNKGKDELINKKMEYLAILIIASLIIFFSIYLLNSNLLKIKYIYLIWGIVLALLPSIAIVSHFPRLISKYVKTACYFFILLFIYEITAIQLGNWSFPGNNFIGWVNIAGYRFPFEEFFFWIILSSIAVISYYEFFDDDCK